MKTVKHVYKITKILVYYKRMIYVISQFSLARKIQCGLIDYKKNNSEAFQPTSTI